MPDQTDNLYAMRHSLAHILATAIQTIWPEAQFGVGPVIEHGFYYDVKLGHAITTQDFPKIEAEMRRVIKADYPFERSELSIEQAIDKVRAEKQSFKVSLLEDLQKHGTTVAKEIDAAQLGLSDNAAKITTVSFYKDGPFEDLCRGPHLESTGKVGVFKLTKVAGAYWRGDQQNEQLQRIYGVGFETQSELDEYLAFVEEAERRDHRKLGKELDLFTFSDLVGPGLPLYTPRGTIIIEELKRALKEISQQHGMLQVSIPHLAKIDLYKLSGHADKFEEELFRVKSHYDQEFVLKPVNCPHHTQIYASQPRSYRDLPLRYIEQTTQYRDEKPGQIGGLQRTRGFTVDDGHTFCRPDQIKEEAATIVRIIQGFYQNLGLWGNHWVSLSLRDPAQPERYIGDAKDWDVAEAMLAEVSKEFKLDAKPMEGEAAIYGPKLDFMFKDALGREVQLATIQLDFAMPKRFDLTYVDSDAEEKTPVMIHRAILGSFERFMMLLIEHYAGRFPVWLAPEQVRLMTVNETGPIAKYAAKALEKMRAQGIRVTLDDSNESVGKKIRKAELMKVPYVLVIGDKERQSDLVEPRLRADMKSQGEGGLPLDGFIAQVSSQVAERTEP